MASKEIDEKKPTQMEGNKEKAARAKEIAENMFSAKDILGAMKYALMARNLFPGLEGISQMITTFGVYIAGMNRINGERDWYAILGVGPLADDATLEKQYKKLIMAFHPDMNKFTGAEGAFILVSDAWSVLSDKAKRVAYDEKVNIIVCNLSTECDPPAQLGANCDDNSTKSNTFWTFCHRCRAHYEYFRAYVNQKLVCHNCHEAFWAVETDRPTSGVYRCAAAWRLLKNRKTINQLVLGESNFHWGPLLRTSGLSSATRAAKLVQHQETSEKMKRKHEEAQAAKGEEALQLEHRVAREGYLNPAKIRRALEDSLRSHDKVRVDRPGKGSVVIDTSCAKGAYRVKLQNLLTQEAIEEISMKLKELKSDDCQEVDEKFKTFLSSSDTCDQNNIEKTEGKMSGSQVTKTFASTTIADMVTKSLEKMSIEVANDGMTEADVEDLINDMDKLGEEKTTHKDI